MKTIKQAVILYFLCTLAFGLLYPVAMCLLATPVAIRSTHIGQDFSDPRYFWGRLSATSPVPYNGAASSGSNLGPLSLKLADAQKARLEALRQTDGGSGRLIPVDLVTASGSGLDPHISPAAATYQIPRVARLRGLPPEPVEELVRKHIEGPQWGIFGPPRVNVLELNRSLDQLATPATGR